MAVTVIEASAEVDGLHHWPQAHEGRAYLRAPHRHRFIVTARVFVQHTDRDIEWHDLRAVLHTALLLAGGGVTNGLTDFGTMSCETLAEHVADYLRRQRLIAQRVSVSEDGEFTAHYYPDVPDPREPA